MLPPPDFDHPDVGAFEEGTPGSRWALGRYLVGRAIGESMSRALTVFALLVVALTALVWWLGPHWLAGVIGVFALTVLLLRSLLGAVLRRVTGADVAASLGDEAAHPTLSGAEVARTGNPPQHRPE